MAGWSGVVEVNSVHVQQTWPTRRDERRRRWCLTLAFPAGERGVATSVLGVVLFSSGDVDAIWKFSEARIRVKLVGLSEGIVR